MSASQDTATATQTHDVQQQVNSGLTLHYESSLFVPKIS